MKGLNFSCQKKKARCMSNKLNDSLTAPKTYGLILNCFLNNRKIPAISSLLVNGGIMTDFS